MCNLYSITTNQAAIIALFRVAKRCKGPQADDALRIVIRGAEIEDRAAAA
jgi:hypothetical protein